MERKIRTCPRCVCHKSLPEKAAPLVNIQVTRPLELVCMDFLSIEPDSRNTKDVLVITDSLPSMRLLFLLPIRSCVLWLKFFGRIS